MNAKKATMLVTAELFLGLHARAPPAALTRSMEARRRQATTGRVTWRVLRSSPRDAMYE